ncbi:hypothetical protein OHB41_01930 [Streptomyces sp. NBC_01571]|uniref:hypothetical protein n=1 Tax=Streptomyces sp. NBC_01571 TaxID=2975883 RepID=UPI0022595617|nr:hypothetical protein [Streptomyces sp. NBC_01571]MCX4571963.1 hypothetical protein [Streptomyces sp. NBC_01571]
MAFSLIDRAPGATAKVARSLSTHPHMITIERAAAGHDILSIVATRELPALSHYTLDLLPRCPDITAVQARVVTHISWIPMAAPSVSCRPASGRNRPCDAHNSTAGSAGCEVSAPGDPLMSITR